MTDTNPTQGPKTELGVGRILGGTFDLYFKNFPLMFGIVFIPYLIYTLLVLNPVSEQLMPSTIDPMASLTSSLAIAGLSGFLVILLQAVVVRMSISLHTGRGAQLGEAIRGAVTGFLPILILGIIAGIATMVGFLLVIVPGLYVLALLYVYVPAIVFEKAGFSALGRSEELTKGYRWVIVGIILILIVLNWILSAIYSAVIFTSVMDIGEITSGSTNPAAIAAATPWWLTIVSAAFQAAVLPIGLIASGLVYARLREIKEGGLTTDLMKVFE